VRTIELDDDEWPIVGLLVSHAAMNRVAIFTLDDNQVTRFEPEGLDVLEGILVKMEEFD
jgi:hypothetical protein